VYYYDDIFYLTTCRCAGTSCTLLIASNIFIVGITVGLVQKITPKLNFMQCEAQHMAETILHVQKFLKEV
jgi:hypothetical protein